MCTCPWIWKHSTALCGGLGFRPSDTARGAGPIGLPGTNPEPWKCISQHMQLLLLSIPKEEYIQNTFKRSSVLAKKNPKHSPITSQFHSWGFQAKWKKSHNKNNNRHSLFPFPNQTVLQNLQSNHKNWQTWKYLHHHELHYISEI